MPKYIVDLDMDGYDTEEIMAGACEEFIFEQLDTTASAVKVIPITEDEYNLLMLERKLLAGYKEDKEKINE